MRRYWLNILLGILILIISCKRNKAPNTPATPSGPSIGYQYGEYSFSTRTTDPNGDDIAYQFYWDDGDSSNWSDFIPSGDSIIMTNSWASAKSYTIKVRAKDTKEKVSSWSNGHQITIRPNALPNIPSVPSGPLSARIGTICNFSTSTIDSDNDSVAYQFDWGDGTYSNWSNFISSGTICTMSYRWSSEGNYSVRARAKDIKGAITNWSNPHTINISNVLIWSRTFGLDDDDIGFSVQPTSDGGYIIVGATATYGSSDVWLIKTDSMGIEQWNRIFGGTSDDYGYSVQQTADRGYIITGTTESFGAGGADIWLIKTDSLGNEQWRKTFGGTSDDYGASVQQTPDGGYILTGSITTGGANGTDVLLIKTNSTGNMQWNKNFHKNEEDYGMEVKRTADNGYIIVGWTYFVDNDNIDVWLIKTDVSGNMQWNKTFDKADEDYGYSVQQTTDGGYIITGYTYSYDLENIDFWLIKTTSSGSRQWDKTFNKTDEDYGYSVQQTSDGGYIITGFTNSADANVWLIKTNSTGIMQWEKIIGGTDDDFGYSVRQSPDGGYIITGATDSYGAGYLDVLLIKTDRAGNFVLPSALTKPTQSSSSKRLSIPQHILKQTKPSLKKD
ncbi:MAG: PKD domain-containing protein [candidate division WOR-3 bacterium]|nr:PKD domain-containing protein [candidate division WOR-3 bacterium]